MSSNSPQPLKVGSAPAGVGIDPSAWRVSPLRKPSRGIVMDAERKLGVLHRIDSQAGFHSSTHLDRVEQMRCPSCRLPRQMLCSNCVSNSLRLARVRDVNHELFLRKAELCRNIDWELKANMNFQSDTYARARSIHQLKQKIIEKTKAIDQLKRALVLTDMRIVKSTKNVQTLQAAATRHAKHIEDNALRNKKLLEMLQVIQDESLKYSRFYTLLLAHYFPLKKCERRDRADDSMMESAMNEKPAPKTWPPMIGCEINKNCEYDRMKSELVEGSSLALSRRACLSFAAFFYLTQLVNSVAFLIDFNLPYRLLLQELAMTHRWTANLFATDVYRLNANIMALCAAHGLKNEVLIVNNPFHNVLLLIQELSKNQITTIKGQLTEQMKHKLVAAFKLFAYEERLQEFNLEHIEEDWVSINFANS